ncbi:hypothetical protein HDU76_005627 [Blyttiomyces sp. JEL0837]|nr:hypothetical protein HDU76_005627 [Blyttiomyces sp. JEL0837]
MPPSRQQPNQTPTTQPQSHPRKRQRTSKTQAHSSPAQAVSLTQELDHHHHQSHDEDMEHQHHQHHEEHEHEHDDEQQQQQAQDTLSHFDVDALDYAHFEAGRHYAAAVAAARSAAANSGNGGNGVQSHITAANHLAAAAAAAAAAHHHQHQHHHRHHHSMVGVGVDQTGLDFAAAAGINLVDESMLPFATAMGGGNAGGADSGAPSSADGTGDGDSVGVVGSDSARKAYLLQQSRSVIKGPIRERLEHYRDVEGVNHLSASAERRAEIAREFNLDQTKVDNWFVNHRRRMPGEGDDSVVTGPGGVEVSSQPLNTTATTSINTIMQTQIPTPDWRNMTEQEKKVYNDLAATLNGDFAAAAAASVSANAAAAAAAAAANSDVVGLGGSGRGVVVGNVGVGVNVGNVGSMSVGPIAPAPAPPPPLPIAEHDEHALKKHIKLMEKAANAIASLGGHVITTVYRPKDNTVLAEAYGKLAMEAVEVIGGKRRFEQAFLAAKTLYDVYPNFKKTETPRKAMEGRAELSKRLLKMLNAELTRRKEKNATFFPWKQFFHKTHKFVFVNWPENCIAFPENVTDLHADEINILLRKLDDPNDPLRLSLRNPVV